MPHSPRPFIDKEHAETLQEHFLRISEMLDAREIAKFNSQTGEQFAIWQRVWILINSPRSLSMVPPDESMESESPETVAAKIAAQYGWPDQDEAEKRKD